LDQFTIFFTLLHSCFGISPVAKIITGTLYIQSSWHTLQISSSEKYCYFSPIFFLLSCYLVVLKSQLDRCNFLCLVGHLVDSEGEDCDDGSGPICFHLFLVVITLILSLISSRTRF